MNTSTPDLVITGQQFSFRTPHFDPEAVSETVSAVWNEIEIAGRSGPLYTYKKTDGMKYSFTIFLFAGGYETDKGLKSTSDVLKKVKEFKSLVYPKYQGGITQPPRKLHIMMGDILNFDAIPTSVNIEYQGIYDKNKLPIFVKIKLDVNRLMLIPKDYNDIIKEG